jgi:hypothetical protein
VALEFCGAATASAARISASAVPARMLDRALRMNAYSTSPNFDRDGFDAASRRDAGHFQLIAAASMRRAINR